MLRAVGPAQVEEEFGQPLVAGRGDHRLREVPAVEDLLAERILLRRTPADARERIVAALVPVGQQ